MTSHAQLAHIWAQLPVDSEKEMRGSRMFFRGNKIYSYGEHYCIAAHVIDRDGIDRYLINNTPSSQSTARHRGHVIRAVMYQDMFLVHNPLAATKEEHKANYMDMKNKLYSVAERIPRLRTTTLYAIAEYKRIVDKMNRYTKAFRLGYKAIPDMDDEQILQSCGVIAEQARKVRAKARATEKARLELEAAEAQDDLEKWLAGEKSELHDHPFIELRMKGDVVQTSKGAEFPVSHAKRAWELIKQAKDPATRKLAKGMRVGHFTIDLLRSDGSVVAGCHDIGFTAMKRLANEQGW